MVSLTAHVFVPLGVPDYPRQIMSRDCLEVENPVNFIALLIIYDISGGGGGGELCFLSKAKLKIKENSGKNVHTNVLFHEENIFFVHYGVYQKIS